MSSRDVNDALSHLDAGRTLAGVRHELQLGGTGGRDSDLELGSG
jgi:hypothetical protein